MAFSAVQAFDLLSAAYWQQRLPHALLIVGDEQQGGAELVLKLLQLLNGIQAKNLDAVLDEYCRIVRPKSKSRRIVRDDIRSIEPFLQQRAALGKWKVAILMEADRMNDEAANAFLKTLEEPPSQCLIILCTKQADQLLQTILSRCVRVDLLQSYDMQLSEIQQTLLPDLVRACKYLNNDLYALSFKNKLQQILADTKSTITQNLKQALKEEAKAVANNTGVADWESRYKEEVNAQIETDYLEQRNQALDLLVNWFGQAVLVASQAPTVTLIHPDVANMAKKVPVPDLLKRMQAVNDLKDDLNFNINEELALNVRFLQAFGTGC